MITYIISDIKKSVFFEHTALLLRNNGIEINFILINSQNTTFESFLKSNNFQIEHIQVSSISKSFKEVIRCRKILKKFKTTTIHCHLGTANWVGLWAGKLAGIKKRIFTRHAGEPLFYSKKEKIIDKIQNFLASDIVSISQNISEILTEQGVSEKKIHLIHHGFDLDRFSVPNTDEVIRIKKRYNPQGNFPLVGVIARWMEWKGIQFTVLAFQKLLIDYPNAKLCLFNCSETADYSKGINKLLESLPQNSYKKIEFEENVYDLYQLFDVYVHVPINPSAEAFGQTYVEALASGIPSIFTLSGIAREFVTEKNAIIVPFKNEISIFEAIKEILNDQPDTEKKIKQGKSDVFEKFGLDTYIKKLIILYD